MVMWYDNGAQLRLRYFLIFSLFARSPGSCEESGLLSRDALLFISSESYKYTNTGAMSISIVLLPSTLLLHSLLYNLQNLTPRIELKKSNHRERKMGYEVFCKLAPSCVPTVDFAG
jgi:hypothetical protein